MTRQICDQLLTSGGALAILEGDPLRDLWTTIPSLRPNLRSPCSALWRGYRTRYQIREGRLFLTDLSAWVQNPLLPDSFYAHPLVDRIGLESLFPAAQGGVVEAGWFSGSLMVQPSVTRLVFRGGQFPTVRLCTRLWKWWQRKWSSPEEPELLSRLALLIDFESGRRFASRIVITRRPILPPRTEFPDSFECK